jgi:hypothetical protein
VNLEEKYRLERHSSARSEAARRRGLYPITTPTFSPVQGISRVLLRRSNQTHMRTQYWIHRVDWPLVQALENFLSTNMHHLPCYEPCKMRRKEERHSQWIKPKRETVT